MSRVLRIATRGSALALLQTRLVGQQLGVDFEEVVIKTVGDKTQQANIPIESMSGQGIFVKEVQDALLDGRADIAVHSAKDLPSTTADGLAFGAVLERGDARDCLVGGSLEELQSGAFIGTGSVRRRAQLASLRPDLTFANLRGNIDTRLKKAEGFDAIVMAYAALQRLNKLDGLSVHVLDPSTMVPQVGQGALAVECRDDDDEARETLSAIEHAESRRVVDAERAFLAELGGSCDLPVGAYGVVRDDEVVLSCLLATPDGRVVLRREGSGRDGIALGRDLAVQILKKDGGAQLLGSMGAEIPTGQSMVIPEDS